MMRKTLMTTVAAAAVVGFATLATAQNMEGQSKGAMSPQGGAATSQGGSQVGGQESGQEQKIAPGGGTSTMQKQDAPSGEKSTRQSAQAPAQNAKPDQRVGQQPQKEMTPQKGAQEERSTPQQGAQEENSKSGNTAAQQNTGKSSPAGASVTLTDNQRSKIQATIGKNSGARVTIDVNFDVTVGAEVPRSVHVAVLPEDVIEIVPQYEGYDYVVVGDNILIVDPATMEIIAVVPA
jgi:hypothetical protein